MACYRRKEFPKGKYLGKNLSLYNSRYEIIFFYVNINTEHPNVTIRREFSKIN